MTRLDNVTGLELPDSFHGSLTSKATVRRATKVSLVVGTILLAINQGDLVLAGIMPPVWKILLTYLVPYSVSSFSTAAFIMDIRRALLEPQNGLAK